MQHYNIDKFHIKHNRLYLEIIIIRIDRKQIGIRCIFAEQLRIFTAIDDN